MPSYHYKASTPDGKLVEGNMEASDDGSVAMKLQEMGLLPVRINFSDRGTFFTKDIDWPWKTKKIRRKDLLIFTQELHTLVKSGFPLDRSLTIIRQISDNQRMTEIVQDILKEVKGGKSFSEALNKYPDVFPRVYVNMIRAGEAGGALEEILRHLTTYLETSDNLRSYIISAMIYPILLSTVALVSITLLTLFIVPKFIQIFDDIGVPLPLPMAFLNGVSTVLSGYWWLILAILAAVALYVQRFRNSTQGRLKLDRWMLRIPLLGIVLRKVEVARFSRALGTLLHGGVPLLQAMTIVREIIGNQSIAKAIDPIRTGIKKGEGITQPMKHSAVFPQLAMHLIEVGEETGKLDVMLHQGAETYDAEVRTSISRLTSFFEPVLIILMGIIIGAIVVSMLTAIFSINDIPL
jgi:type II secretory pathway component PulF